MSYSVRDKLPRCAATGVRG